MVSVNTPDATKDGSYQSMDGWTGPEARAARIKGPAFPDLLAPVDDLPPATLITSVQHNGTSRIVRGIAHDNGDIATVTVNGLPATIAANQAGIADWTITLDAPANGRYLAKATDIAGNAERMPHEVVHQGH